MSGPAPLLDVVIVIPNFNGASILGETLEALPLAAGRLSTAVVLVDNASTDDSVARVQSGFPEVQIIRNPENLGFAVACNRGGQTLDSRHVLLLNSDVTMPPGSLEALVHEIDSSPRLGALSPLTHWPDGRVQGPPMPRWRRRQGGRVSLGWLPGTCLLLRRQALDAVGWLDEDFFFYNEDLDLSWRLRRGGWQLACATRVHVRHHEGVATRTDREVLVRAIREGFAGTVLLARKHYPWATPVVRWAVRLDVNQRCARTRARMARGEEPSFRDLALLDAQVGLEAALHRQPGTRTPGTGNPSREKERV